MSPPISPPPLASGHQKTSASPNPTTDATSQLRHETIPATASPEIAAIGGGVERSFTVREILASGSVFQRTR